MRGEQRREIVMAVVVASVSKQDDELRLVLIHGLLLWNYS